MEKSQFNPDLTPNFRLFHCTPFLCVQWVLQHTRDTRLYQEIKISQNVCGQPAVAGSWDRYLQWSLVKGKGNKWWRGGETEQFRREKVMFCTCHCFTLQSKIQNQKCKHYVNAINYICKWHNIFIDMTIIQLDEGRTISCFLV